MKYSIYTVLTMFICFAEISPNSEMGHAGNVDENRCHYFGNTFHCH